MNEHEVIPIINRAQVISDTLSLAKSGLLDYSTALDLTRYLEKETEFIPWDAALESFTFLHKMISQTQSYRHFRVCKAIIVTFP